jgi:hypothetical protein
MATGELVEEVTGEVADHLEEVAEVTRRISGRELSFIFSGGVVGLAGGLAVGYFLTKSKLETKYAQIAEEEIAEYREHYRRKTRAHEATSEKAELEAVVKDAGYIPYSDVAPAEVPETDPEKPAVVETTVNVFTQPEPETPEWDQETEEKDRSSTQPYVIHKDEYKANEKEYDQKTLAYYADDDVLANDEDRPIHTTEGLVPSDFAEKFGHGSGDPNVVYVRCDEVACEFEIIRNNGNFAEVVHGFLKHSEERGRRHKPRFDDD